MNVPTFNEIWDEILSEKIIKKNKQYGNSIEEPVMVFNHYSVFPQDLIDVRLDDKLSRIRELADDEPKYWSEIKEIIAYLMWKLYIKTEEDRHEAYNNSGYEGNAVKSAEYIRKVCDSHLPTLGLRRLSGK